jgi:hypothetical protein
MPPVFARLRAAPARRRACGTHTFRAIESDGARIYLRQKMNNQEWNDVRAILAHRGFGGPTAFDYYRDRYAICLLEWALRMKSHQPMNVRRLKQSPFASLVEKPSLAKALARCGTRAIEADWLRTFDHADGMRRYTLTLGTWGTGNDREMQTSRRGLNMVVQLNFDEAHDRAYQRKVKPQRGAHPIADDWHPIAKNRNTLAWARIDLDLRTGEALIEEVQSDWVREAARLRDDAADALHAAKSGARQQLFSPWAMRGNAKQFESYDRNYVEPHRKDWHEATLLATIWVIRELLGIRHIYFHTPESGSALKSISSWNAPPRSLYTDLPRRFCFRPFAGLPQFLRGRPRDEVHAADVTMQELVL